MLKLSNLHEVLQGERAERGLTQAQLAKRIGVTRGYLSEMENGKHPSLAMFVRLCKALGRTPNQMLGVAS